MCIHAHRSPRPSQVSRAFVRQKEISNKIIMIKHKAERLCSCRSQTSGSRHFLELREASGSHLVGPFTCVATPLAIPDPARLSAPFNSCVWVLDRCTWHPAGHQASFLSFKFHSLCFQSRAHIFVIKADYWRKKREKV